MRSFQIVLLLAMTLASAGCYHAMVVTGKTPSTVVIDQPFASGWVYGLVPPKTVESAAGCPDGIAMVETELSFVNQLVSFLTFGIYTPMHIKVTCAMAGTASVESTRSDITISNAAQTGDVLTSFEVAADRAVETGAPVYVRFETAVSD